MHLKRLNEKYPHFTYPTKLFKNLQILFPHIKRSINVTVSAIVCRLIRMLAFLVNLDLHYIHVSS